MERFGGVVRENGHLNLLNDLTRVHPLIDVVNGAAGDLFPGFQSLTPRLQTGELRQERGVDIDDAAGEGLQERRLHHAHVAGEDDIIDAGGLELGHDGFLDLL